MKIVVLDGYTENPGDISWGPIEALGEVTVYDRTAYEESPLIAERIGDADVIVINKTPISKETMDQCPNLKAIAVLATGYNVVDYEYAKAKGIPVMNVPVYGTDNVSQFAVSLLLEVCSHIGHHSDSVYAGEWAENADWCYWHYPMIEVSGKTAGIIGLGRIGVNTAKILKAMNVTHSRARQEKRLRTMWNWMSCLQSLTLSSCIARCSRLPRELSEKRISRR